MCRSPFSSSVRNTLTHSRIESGVYVCIERENATALHSPWLLAASSSPFDSHGSRQQLDYKVPVPVCQRCKRNGCCCCSTRNTRERARRELAKIQAEIPIVYTHGIHGGQRGEKKGQSGATSGKYFASISGSGDCIRCNWHARTFADLGHLPLPCIDDKSPFWNPPDLQTPPALPEYFVEARPIKLSTRCRTPMRLHSCERSSKIYESFRYSRGKIRRFEFVAIVR